MELIDSTQAAEILGVNRTAVLKMARNGILRSKFSKDERWFEPNEVHKLKEIRKSGMSLAEVAIRAARAEMAVFRLEKQVTQLLNIIGADIPSADISPEAVQALHLRVEDAAKDTRMPHVNDLMFWGQTFMSLSEQYFQVVSEAFVTDEPWKHYIELSNRLVTSVPHAKMRNDLELQTAYNYLEMARRGMRQTMFFYIQMRGSSRLAYQLFPEGLNDVHEKVLSMVSYISD